MLFAFWWSVASGIRVSDMIWGDVAYSARTLALFGYFRAPYRNNWLTHGASFSLLLPSFLASSSCQDQPRIIKRSLCPCSPRVFLRSWPARSMKCDLLHELNHQPPPALLSMASNRQTRLSSYKCLLSGNTKTIKELKIRTNKFTFWEWRRVKILLNFLIKTSYFNKWLL